MEKIRIGIDMAPQNDDLTLREKVILGIIEAQTGRMITADIYRLAPMAKATALKHLEVLEAKGLIYQENLGQVKVWWPVRHCQKCGAAMIPTRTYICPDCNEKRRP